MSAPDRDMPSDATASRARPSRGIIGLTVATVAVFALLVGLGTWQMQRRQWKAGLLAQIAARATAPAVPLADMLPRARAGEDLEYVRVSASGTWLPKSSLFLYAPEPTGPGYHLFGALALQGGGVVLVNRGFVPETWRQDRGLAEKATTGDAVVVGLIRKPEVAAMFSPVNDARGNLWYWRDLAAMANAAAGAKAGEVIPVFLDAEAAEGAPATRYPRGGGTRLTLTDKHLEYAVTWYGLAATLLVVYASFLFRRFRSGP